MKAGEFLERIYDRIVDAHGYHRETFPPEQEIATLICSDCDDHRRRHGFMKYEFADFVEIDNKIWVISLGNSWGSYPADPYDKDIIALHWLKEPEKPEEELIPRIIEGRVFRNSIVYAMADGRLGLTGKFRSLSFLDNKNRFGEAMATLVRDKMPELSIHDRAPGDMDNLICYLYPANIKYSGHCFGEKVYDQKLVPKLAATIEELLSG